MSCHNLIGWCVWFLNMRWDELSDVVDENNILLDGVDVMDELLDENNILLDVVDELLDKNNILLDVMGEF